MPPPQYPQSGGGQYHNPLPEAMWAWEYFGKNARDLRQIQQVTENLAAKKYQEYLQANPTANPQELQAKAQIAATQEMVSRGYLNTSQAQGILQQTGERVKENEWMANARPGQPPTLNAANVGSNLDDRAQARQRTEKGDKYWSEGSNRLNLPPPTSAAADQVSQERYRNAEAEAKLARADYDRNAAAIANPNKIPTQQEAVLFIQQMQRQGIPEPLIRDYMISHASASQNPQLGGEAYQRSLQAIQAHSQKMTEAAKAANQIDPKTGKPYPVPGARTAVAAPAAPAATPPPAAAPAATAPPVQEPPSLAPATAPAATPPPVTPGVNEATPPAPPPPTKGPGGTTVPAPAAAPVATGDNTEASYTPQPLKPTGYNPVAQLFGLASDSYSKASKEQAAEKARGEEFKAALAQRPNITPEERQQLYQRYRSGQPLTEAPQTAAPPQEPPAATPGVMTPPDVRGAPTAQAAPDSGWLGVPYGMPPQAPPEIQPPASQNNPMRLFASKDPSMPGPVDLETNVDLPPAMQPVSQPLPPIPIQQRAAYAGGPAEASQPAQQFAAAQPSPAAAKQPNPFERLAQAGVGGYTPQLPELKQEQAGGYNPQMMAAVEQQGMRRDQAQAIAAIIQGLLGRRV